MNISSWETSNVINISGLFTGAQYISDLANWDTSNVLYMDYIFRGVNGGCLMELKIGILQV